MSTAQELIQRWDTFLNSIESRFNESLQHAESACLDLIEENGYDYLQTMQSWIGMQAQIRNLSKKIESTWEGKVGPLMQEQEQIDFYNEREKGTALDFKLYKNLEAFNTVLEGKVSQKYYNHAIEIIDQDFHCSQCSAKLGVIKNLFRAQYITCDYCDVVNTFNPDYKFKLISNVIDNILKYRFQNEYEELNKLSSTISDSIDELSIPESQWERYKNAYMAYYEAYFKARIELNLSYKDRFEEDMERKQLDFNNLKKQHNYGSYQRN